MMREVSVASVRFALASALLSALRSLHAGEDCGDPQEACRRQLTCSLWLVTLPRCCTTVLVTVNVAPIPALAQGTPQAFGLIDHGLRASRDRTGAGG